MSQITLPRIETRYHLIELRAWGCRTYKKGSNWYVDAIPHETAHYFIIAARLGYQDDIYRYCWEHELAHCVVAEYLKNDTSLVLRHIAKMDTVSRWDITAEELLAQTLQRFANANEEPIISDINWHDMRRIFYKYRDMSRDP